MGKKKTMPLSPAASSRAISIPFLIIFAIMSSYEARVISTPSRDFCYVYSEGTYHPYALGVAAGRSLGSLRDTLIGNIDRAISSYKCDRHLIMTLYEDENFQGKSTQVSGESVSLFDWDNRARSLRVVDTRGEPAADVVGRGCSLFKPCPNGYSCQPGIHKCYEKERREGQPCSAGYSCADGLVCEAGVQRCARPGGINEPCHATRPCASGLQCEGVKQVCRAFGETDTPCHITRRCAEGFCCDRSQYYKLDFWVDIPADGVCMEGYSSSGRGGYC